MRAETKSIRIPVDVYGRLKERAGEQGVTMQEAVRRAVEGDDPLHDILAAVGRIEGLRGG